MIDATIPTLLTEAQAAEVLGVKPATLTVWRSTHRYPLAYVKIGGRVRYRAQDITAFLDSRIVRPGEAGR
jgi:predicted DNA-binding transcriptional regulator AlpA